jgi:hypothetical protein
MALQFRVLKQGIEARLFLLFIDRAQGPVVD